MAAFVTRSEVKSLWKPSVKKMIRECKTRQKAPAGLVELIKHNLYAKYVSYDTTGEQIEIGVNESLQPAASYPTLSVYNIPLNELEQKLRASYKPGRNDVEFYAKILTQKSLKAQVLIV